ncbi:SNF2 helicase associated domain-containing protein [Hazenella sp. IB182357]|uniref:SNF2 helicase associated domain-containing protein n=1 Tax=Polycladospora coralii TaxID=2771432 RepID=A0A926RT78_9BACL|nr:SNF2 helicase associated domain-containing protein [Polycladospora coralii]MBD1371353.1 SNF2 helicase associated domain-containing protein [Polycladospora coralii]
MYLDLQLEISDIQSQSASLRTYERGEYYYRDGRVDRIEYNSTYAYYRSLVEGQQAYEVMIYMESNGVDVCECSCPAFNSYEGYCKHIVATLLAILYGNKQKAVEESLSIEETRQRSRYVVTDLINLFQTDLQKTESAAVQTPLIVQYFLELVPSHEEESELAFTVELKVGHERLYVVKRIGEFLNAYKQREELYFTKKFTYDPKKEIPDKHDQAMLEFLVELHDHEMRYRQILNPWSYEGTSKERTLTIPSHQLERFLHLLPPERFNLEHLGSHYAELPIVEGQFPISFSLHEGEGELILQSKITNATEQNINERLQREEPALLSEKGHCFYQGRIFRLTDKQQKLLLPLHRQIQEVPKRQLVIPASQVEEAISILVPPIKKEANLIIDQEISDKIVQQPLGVEIYLDRSSQGNKECLTAQITYLYGNERLDPFHSSETERTDEKILIRDTEKEQQVMGIFESVDFKYNGETLYLEDEDAQFHFLYDHLPQLRTLADLYMTESFQRVMIENKHIPTPRVNMNETMDWLEIQFEVPEVNEEELNEMLKAFVEKKTYYRLKDGGYVPLQTELTASIQDLFSDENHRQALLEGHKLKLPAYRAMQLEETLSTEVGAQVKKGQLFRRLIRNMKDPESAEYQPPTQMASILRDYQLIGYQWMKMLNGYRFGGILADEMGLGKTIQALAFITSELESNAEYPVLVVAPASLVYNWEHESNRFAPHLKTLVLAGNKDERERRIQELSEYDLIITSYPLLRRDIDQLESIFFRSLILDEAQNFKNQQSQTAQAVKRIKAGTRFALSGTPIENKVDELWSIFDVILPGLFPNQTVFRRLSKERIAKRVRPFVLRRMKRDVLTELPPKIESIRYSELTTEQKKVYLATLEKIRQDTKASIQSEGFHKSRMKILAGLTRLRQICCHPSLYLENYQAESGKMHQLFELLEELFENGHRVLLFSQYTSMLGLIRTEFKERQLDYHYIDGQTPSKERLELVRRFNQGEKEIFLISLRAGGTGLNLTGADTVILYDLWWNPAVEQQAADRAHRMGQNKNVQVLKLITRGTIEEKIYELQQQKQALFEQVIQPGEEMLNTLSEENIKEILDIQ